jgi:putative hydrolase of the HAD superfamily
MRNASRRKPKPRLSDLDRMTAPAPRYRAVLFDALGTLVALEPPWPSLRRTLRDRHGIEISEQRAKEAMQAEMSYYRDHHAEGADAASLAQLRRRCAAVLREHLPEAGSIALDDLTEVLLDALRFTPYPDAAPTLAALRRAGLRLAVVSNWDCSLRSVLAEVGLAAAVDEVVVSAEVGVEKPDARIFAAALAKLRRGPEESLFVGDSIDVDIVGARSAGLRAVLLDRAATPAEHRSERIFSLADLVALVLPSAA